MLIKKISKDSDLNKEIIINGWIRTYRKQNDLCFFNLNDGSEPNGLQVICSKDNSLFEELDNVCQGCYIKVSGLLIESPASGQDLELQLKKIIEIGSTNSFEYPIKKKIKIDTLRQIAHLRPRTKTISCVFRIRNTIMYETHNFFQSKDFLNLDPNIITINECEGGAGVFTVTELLTNKISDIPVNKNMINYKKDHFKKQAYLTVSSQLQLEALACSMGNVYTMNKSFRSEHSSTNKHASEFTHLEIEMIDIDNMELMKIGEEYIKYIINKVVERNSDDIDELNHYSCRGLKSKIEELKELKFNYVSYDECLDTLINKMKLNIEYGEDLSSDAEKVLTEYYNGAVFVYNWPYNIKSFYMKQSNDGKKLCYNFDLLMPYGIGELIGGSMREDDYDNLLNGMNTKGVSSKNLQWYLDLRKYGTVKHGGFGLGIDRLIMMMTGMKNIRDVIPFPVNYENCNY
jgi:asparaginyl-tRNA synthetase